MLCPWGPVDLGCVLRRRARRRFGWLLFARPFAISIPSLLVALSISICVRAILSLAAAGVGFTRGFPADAGDLYRLWAFSSPSFLVRGLMSQVDSTSLSSFFDAASPPLRAQMISSADSLACLPWRSTPTTDDLLLTSDEVMSAARIRLGLPPAEGLEQESCVCGAALADPYHYFSCQRLRGSVVTDRHDRLKSAIASLCSSIGCVTHVEPTYRSDSGGGDAKRVKRPDILVWTPRGDSMLDVSVTCAAAGSYAVAGQRHLGAAAVRESRKKTKYEELARRERARFVPVVFEAHGAWGEQAQRFVHFLGGVAEAASVAEAGERTASTDGVGV